MTTTFDEDARVRELLAPLASVTPVMRSSRRRRLLALAVAVPITLFTIGGIATAAGIGPFAGIGAADHPATPGDAIDPAVKAEIDRANNRPAFGPTGQLIADTARLVTTLDSGRRIYVIATTTNMLCVLIQETPGASDGSAIGCGNPLSQAQPTTEMTIRANQQTPPLSYGVARDDVTSVSFQADGIEKTIPVVNNVWAYEGSADILRTLTVHFSDGTETTLDHG